MDNSNIRIDGIEEPLGWLLEEIYVTWAHLEKKRTRLPLYTKSLEKYAYSEFLSEARTLCKDLLQKVPHHGIDLWLQVQIFYDHVNSATRLSKFEADFKQQQGEMTNKIDTVLKAINDRITKALPSDTVKNLKLNDNLTSPVFHASNLQKDQLQTVNKIGTSKLKEPAKTLEEEFKDLHLNLPVLEVLAHAPIYNALVDKYVESLELGKNGSAFIQGKMPEKMKDPGLFTLPYGTKSYPVGVVKNVEVHIVKLKLLDDFYVIDMYKDPTTLLLVGRGFLATANAIIDCKKAKIVVGEGVTRSILELPFPGEWEIARDAELNPFKDVLNKPPKRGDGAWHAKIRLIDPDGVQFTKTFQSIPATRKLSEKDNPSKIIDLDHFHDS
ncbi:retrovirus-related pol polyprotein from transposon TNT 1-94 [Tanacetum coccineum]